MISKKGVNKTNAEFNKRLPKGWDSVAHSYWLQGNNKTAIEAVLTTLNASGEKKPLPLVMQFSYYLYLTGDSASAAQLLGIAKKDYPRDIELLLNLGVFLSKSGQYEKAVENLKEVISLKPTTYTAFDSLANCYYKLGQNQLAAEAGTLSLELKDKLTKVTYKNWSLPNDSPNNWLASSDKKNTIAFSLWGNKPRYLRGAIDNALSAAKIYPDWKVRIYLDLSVPLDIQETLLSLGVDLRLEPSNQSLLQRLSWRFKVADDLNVGRFIIRDIDSVINQREKSAVDQWIASDKWFHVMRDWWTHSDLILAGMWGGVANVLPNMSKMIDDYNSPTMETPNIDQWFLRDEVWQYIRLDCLVHDRCFNTSYSYPWPFASEDSNIHVGQNEFTVNHAEQEIRLKHWLTNVQSLHN